MANRCSDCNKFVATDIEVTNTEVDDFDPDSGFITLRLSVSKNCAECGAEVATGEVEFDVDVPDATWDKALKVTEFEPA